MKIWLSGFYHSVLHQNNYKMREKYYPPQFEEAKFHCVYCEVYAKQDWFNLYYYDSGESSIPAQVSICLHCNEKSLWWEGRMIVPSEVTAELMHPDMPEDCQTEYIEAGDVFTKSPRSSAALLRLCIQKLMPHLGEKGKNINEDIKSLVSKGLPPLVQQALDVCRVVGNNAVHPGEINLNDTPEVALSLFQMINFIVEDRITRPKQIDALYNQLPQSSRDAITKRDASA